MSNEGFAEPWIKVRKCRYTKKVSFLTCVQFEKELGFRPLLHGPIEECFKGWETLGGALVSKFQFPSPDASVKTEDREIPGGLKVRIYTPPGYSGNKPLGIYIHGGGWAMGDLDADDAGCRAISKGVGVVLVSVEYRLAPAHPYPSGLDDCLTAFKWALKNADSLGANPEKAFIAGASAGGGSSLGLALKLVDEGLGGSLLGAVAQVPVTVHPDLIPSELKSKFTSYKENAENTVNSESAMYAFWDAYGNPKDEYANPLLHKKLKELPKVYITCAGQDTLRDDARLMRDLLKKEG
jgi:versiconal hemiacetal acetate esterase